MFEKFFITRRRDGTSDVVAYIPRSSRAGARELELDRKAHTGKVYLRPKGDLEVVSK